MEQSNNDVTKELKSQAVFSITVGGLMKRLQPNFAILQYNFSKMTKTAACILQSKYQNNTWWCQETEAILKFIAGRFVWKTHTNFVQTFLFEFHYSSTILSNENDSIWKNTCLCTIHENIGPLIDSLHASRITEEYLIKVILRSKCCKNRTKNYLKDPVLIVSIEIFSMS